MVFVSATMSIISAGVDRPVVKGESLVVQVIGGCSNISSLRVKRRARQVNAAALRITSGFTCRKVGTAVCPRTKLDAAEHQ